MKKLLPISLVLATSVGHAAIVDDYEHNNSSLYTNLNSSGTYQIDGSAAFAGAFGGLADGNSFWARQDIATNAGSTVSAMVRTIGPIGDPTNISGAGRVYLGVGASFGGMWSAVFAPNTGEIMLQDNTSFGFIEMGHTAVSGFTTNTWYMLSLDWAVNGDMQVSLFDSTGSSLIAQTGVFSTGFTTSGWLGTRVFGVNHIDDIDMNPVPEPASIVAIGLGVTLLALRRRSR